MSLWGCRDRDNIPFHAVNFPATLLGSGEVWKTVDTIKAFHWLQFEGGKFSTSQGRGVFADAALEEGPADAWRWWLTANAPETADTEFSARRFAADVDGDLADSAGNFVNRAISFAGRAWEGIPVGGEPGDDERSAGAAAQALLDEVRARHEALDFRRALSATRELWALANTTFQKAEPWRKVKTDKDTAAAATRSALALAKVCAAASWCVVPSFSQSLLAALGEDGVPGWPCADEVSRAHFDAALPETVPLFPKFGEDGARKLEARFG